MMIPGFFKKPSKKLLYINKLNNSYIPNDVLNIIKDYAFYNIESLNFIKKVSAKKKELMYIKLAWSRNNLPSWQRERRFPGEPTSPITETSSHWFFGFTFQDIPSFNLIDPVGLDIDTVKLQGENCTKCGEYTYLCYSYKSQLRSKIGICFCDNLANLTYFEP